MGRSSRAAVLAVSCAIFASIGLLAALGPALPDMAAQTGTTLEAVGAMWSALFLGSLICQAASGFLLERFGYRIVLLMGLALMSGGLLGATLSQSLPLALLFMGLAGVGDGVLIVGANVLVSLAFGKRRVTALNLLNVFFGAGAMLGPAIAGLSLGLWRTALPALWLVVLTLALTIPFVALLDLRETVAPDETPLPEAEQSAPRRALYRAPTLWALGTLLLLYVGTETGTGGWTSAYLGRTTQLTPEQAALVVSGFWMALTGGRVLGAAIGARYTPERLLLLSLSGTLIGGLLLPFSTGSALLTIMAVLILGLGLGPIYPTTIAIITTTFRHSPGKAMSVVAALGSLGGAGLPWIQGVLLERGGPHASVLFTAATTLVMMALFVGMNQLRARRAIKVTVSS